MKIPLLTLAVNALREANFHRTAEVFFVGYPKTGNTWTRFLVGRYLQLVTGAEEMLLFDGYDRLGRCQRAAIGPAMHFTHAPLVWSNQTAANLDAHMVVRPFQHKRVVLIARHPLDTLVSSWLQARHRSNDFSGGLNEFLEDSVYGFEKLVRFYNIWAEHRHTPRALFLLRYEDLRADTLGHFNQLIRFLGQTPNDELTRRAIDYGSFENMRKIEESGNTPRYKSSGLGVFATGDRNNPEAYHVRKGNVGGYRNYLTELTIAQYESRISATLDPWYGYQLLGEASTA